MEDTTGPHRIITKRRNVMINDHIRQLWLSIDMPDMIIYVKAKSRTPGYSVEYD